MPVLRDKRTSGIKTLLSLLLPLLLISAVVLSGCTEAPTQTIEDVTPQEAYDLIEANLDNPDFMIIDVRTASEFATGYIENAVNIDFNGENFAGEIGALDKSKVYLVYCSVGGRSSNAVNEMAALGFHEVYNMSGGFNNWLALGLPDTE